nr:vitelline membrane protein 15a-3 [Aedes albopictus]
MESTDSIISLLLHSVSAVTKYLFNIVGRNPSSSTGTMNKFIILALFAVAAASAMPNYPAPKPAYHAPAPAHHAPAPAHHAPAPAYGHHAHHAPAPVVHTYPVHAPHAKCGANLLVGCAPSVAHVPCVPVHGHGHGYGHAPAPHYRAPESDSFDQFEE